MFELRPYQTRAVDHVLERERAGVRRLLVVAPTGAGKATLAAELALQFAIAEKRVLFVAHRRELILQAYRRFADHGIPERELGVIMADDPRRRPRALVQIASIDTLRARTKPRAKLVMVDEAHRALAKSYRDLETHYPHALHLGFTATPYRASGRGLGDAYDELFAVATPKELIADGYLVEPRAYTIPAERRPDLSRVRVRKGDYDERALADAMDRGALVGDIVEHWKKHASGVRTVAFAASVAHSKHIAERFRAAGVPAEHLDGTMAAAERDAIIARIDRGETLVVSNMGILQEGWDQPSVKCAILARPTKSTGLYLQQAGRILRPWDGQRATILDHAGCVLEHGLPQEDRPFSLGARPSTGDGADRDAAPPVRVCPSCHAILPIAARACTSCQKSLFVEREREGVPEESDGQLIVATEDVVRRAEWDRLCETATARGYQPGWAFHQFRERFGEPPPAAWPRPRPIQNVDVRSIATRAVRHAHGRLRWDAFG